MKGKKSRVKVLAAVLLAAAFALAGGIAHTLLFAPVGEGTGKVIVRIEPGSDLSEITRTLNERGIISHPMAFLWGARLAGLEKKLRSGEHEVDPAWSLPTVLKALASGRGRIVAVTFPEGISMEQIAARLEKAGVTEGEAFLALARDRSFLDSMNIPGPTAEGFLFPETYHFSASSSPERVISAMVRQFFDIYRQADGDGQAGSLSLLEAVTLASMVEKETSLPEERPTIAAVFHNRLRLGYRLQCDPTVIYGLENFDGNLTRRHLKAPTPYNTYVIPGLPPGPIASPGRGSLEAVLNPADVPYLYFVSRNDGSHQFSRTLAEHNRAVRRYQVARRGR